ncbi:hypothetical protein P7C70_g7713, partial [Phenoliferia sp. Uapishka_3]
LPLQLGTRLKVVAIIDPSAPTAEAVLARKRASFVVSAYAATRICPTFDDFVETMSPEEVPHAFIIGSPPAFRGSTKPRRDIEMAILRAFPNKTPAMFIEKPISTDTVENAVTVSRALYDAKTVVSVGYFLRYLKGVSHSPFFPAFFTAQPKSPWTVVQKMRSIIEDNDLHVMATVARYVCSYAKIAKPSWWMKSRDCGPIVEQGTHFIDLSRYFGGDVDMASVQANSLEWYEEAGQLSVIPVDEDAIPEDDRIPRVTSATWFVSSLLLPTSKNSLILYSNLRKYESGAVGSLTHALILQGTKYSTELEIYADGYQLRLIDPYNAPSLRIRRPETDDEEVCTFASDDPYFGELQAFIDACDPTSASTSAVADDDAAEILSTFDDSVKTYALSWAIREASERSLKTARRQNANK